MVDPKLGTKRVCEACGAKFYDLNKSPAVCPKCGNVYDPAVAMAADEPVRDIAPTAGEKETDDEALDDDDDALSLEDMAEEETADSDDDDETLEQFDEDEALLDGDDEDETLLEDEEEESFLEDDEEDE